MRAAATRPRLKGLCAQDVPLSCRTWFGEERRHRQMPQKTPRSVILNVGTNAIMQLAASKRAEVVQYGHVHTCGRGHQVDGAGGSHQRLHRALYQVRLQGGTESEYLSVIREPREADLARRQSERRPGSPVCLSRSKFDVQEHSQSIPLVLPHDVTTMRSSDGEQHTWRPVAAKPRSRPATLASSRVLR